MITIARISYFQVRILTSKATVAKKKSKKIEKRIFETIIRIDRQKQTR